MYNNINSKNLKLIINSIQVKVLLVTQEYLALDDYIWGKSVNSFQGQTVNLTIKHVTPSPNVLRQITDPYNTSSCALMLCLYAELNFYWQYSAIATSSPTSKSLIRNRTPTLMRLKLSVICMHCVTYFLWQQILWIPNSRSWNSPSTEPNYTLDTQTSTKKNLHMLEWPSLYVPRKNIWNIPKESFKLSKRAHIPWFPHVPSSCNFLRTSSPYLWGCWSSGWTPHLASLQNILWYGF